MTRWPTTFVFVVCRRARRTREVYTAVRDVRAINCASGCSAAARHTPQGSRPLRLITRLLLLRYVNALRLYRGYT